jgi:hypothetical protein
MSGHHQPSDDDKVEWSPDAFQIAPDLRQVIWLMVDQADLVGWAPRQ